VRRCIWSSGGRATWAPVQGARRSRDCRRMVRPPRPPSSTLDAAVKGGRRGPYRCTQVGRPGAVRLCRQEGRD
jgi:hypothetical protein